MTRSAALYVKAAPFCAMSKKDEFALVRRRPTSVQKAEVGPKRIVSGMVADTLALVRATASAQRASGILREDSEELEELNRRGNAYYAGIGVQRDYVQAAKWYRQAAEQGYAPAQFNLACCYEHGQGVARDYFKQAKAWYLKAAEQGHALAQYVYYLYRVDSAVPNDEEAARWLKKSAEQGHLWAQHQLGVNYEIGQAGFPQDHSRAATWYRRAAEQGSGGESSLRYCYDHSPTFFQDMQHHAIIRKLAKYSVGCCYRDGRGVLKDKVEAFKWFVLAFEQNRSRPTTEELASLQATLNPAEVAEAQRRCDEFKRGSVDAAETQVLASKRHNKEAYSAALRAAPTDSENSPKYVKGEQ